MGVRASCGCPLLGGATAPDGFVFSPAGPFDAQPSCSGLVLGAVRAYPSGAEESFLARVTGLEPEHAAAALERAEREGWVASEETTVPWYYRTRAVRLWKERPRKELLGQPSPRFVGRSPRRRPDRIPPQFWFLFQSGLDPMLIRLPEHAWPAASRLIAPEGSPRYIPAETWALENLPSWALRKLLDARGYSGTVPAARIESAAARLAESADFHHEVTVEPNGVRVLVDGLDVQVWKSEDGDVPVETGPIVSGMRLASLPDLFALKLHTVGRRAQFRDYLDIETLTRRVMSLEDGLRSFALRYELTLDNPALLHILERLAPPWPEFPPDPTFDPERNRVLDALRRAAEQALAWLSRSGTDDHSGDAPQQPRQPLTDVGIGHQGG